MTDLNSRPTWLYSLLSAGGHASQDVVYVGVTSHLPSRLQQHKADKPWWGEVDYVIAYCYSDRERALTWEAEFIRHHRPRFNHEVPPQPVIPDGWDANLDPIDCTDLYAEDVA